jgi:hypothetical protein
MAAEEKFELDLEALACSATGSKRCRTPRAPSSRDRAKHDLDRDRWPGIHGSWAALGVR